MSGFHQFPERLNVTASEPDGTLFLLFDRFIVNGSYLFHEKFPNGSSV